MKLAGFVTAAAILAAHAQEAPERQRSPEPPSIAIPRSMCEALAGAERERSGADEKPRWCDRLAGPERELCLKQGGRARTTFSPDS